MWICQNKDYILAYFGFQMKNMKLVSDKNEILHSLHNVHTQLTQSIMLSTNPTKLLWNVADVCFEKYRSNRARGAQFL